MKTNISDYRVVLSRLKEEDGGGWLAEMPELKGCISDGETQQEALTNAQEAIRDWIASAEEMGWKVPKPAPHSEPAFSGKFTLRLPKSLHRHLSERAEIEGVSLNQLILSMISYSAGAPSSPIPRWEQNVGRGDVSQILLNWYSKINAVHDDYHGLAASADWQTPLVRGLH